MNTSETFTAPDPKFAGQMLMHLHQLKVLYRNKRGRDRRCYTDFLVRGECRLPCGCMVARFTPAHVRIYEDGQLRHNGCSSPMKVPANITDQIQGMLMTSNAERRRVPKSRKPQARQGIYSCWS